MAQPSENLRRRAFVAARGRVQKLNTAAALKGRFRPAPAPRVGRVAGDNLVAVDGVVYNARISDAGNGTIYVVNAGRLAAAAYVQTSSTGEVKA